MHHNYQHGGRISFYKPGDGNTWTNNSTAHLGENYYKDMICNNEKLFGLTKSGTLHVWDFSNWIIVKRNGQRFKHCQPGDEPYS